MAHLGEAPSVARDDDTAMQSAAHQALTGGWRVSRDGSLLAVIDIREQGGSVVVSTTVDGTAKRHHFTSLEGADRFLRDLTASFAYLGCELSEG